MTMWTGRVALAFVLVTGAAPPSQALASRAGGDTSSCTIVGTSGDDDLEGTLGPDVICGLAGNDTIRGLANDDVLVGGRGSDVLLGGAGNDVLLGGWGNDLFDGGAGYNTCLQGAGTGAQTDCQASDWRTTDTSYSMRVLVLKFFPIAPDGRHIDITVTGDVGDLVSVIKQRVNSIDSNLVADLTEGSAYHGYADPSAPPALSYRIAAKFEFDQAVPTELDQGNPNYPVRPDYRLIMKQNHICTWVDQRGIDEVWMWAYQGPHQLGISESKMSGPNGDISNSARLNDMPICEHTYTVYTYNYGRGTGEAMESHSHQLEAEFAYVDDQLFRQTFEGPAYPGNTSEPGRCGSVHNPPNARFEYDRGDTQPHPSDCLAWDPDGLGPLTDISCANWTCVDNGDADNPVVDYLVWWMQNLPSMDNGLTYQGREMRDWWDVHAAWDDVVTSSRSLTL